MIPLTAERLRAVLNYDPETGIFTRRIAVPTSPVGTIAGSPGSKDYWQVGVDGPLYKAHRLAWLYVYGEWPAAQIDHINGNKRDNRIANLRSVTGAENTQNILKARSDSQSGYRGVTWSPTKRAWTAQITANGRRHYLGQFTSIDDARAAYLAAKQRLHSWVGAS